MSIKKKKCSVIDSFTCLGSTLNRMFIYKSAWRVFHLVEHSGKNCGENNHYGVCSRLIRSKSSFYRTIPIIIESTNFFFSLMSKVDDHLLISRWNSQGNLKKNFYWFTNHSYWSSVPTIYIYFYYFHFSLVQGQDKHWRLVNRLQADKKSCWFIIVY